MTESTRQLKPEEFIKPRWFMQNQDSIDPFPGNTEPFANHNRPGAPSYEFTLKDYVWYPDGGNNLANYLKGTRFGPGIDKVLETMKDTLDTSKKIENTSKIIVHEFEPQTDYQYILGLYSKLFKSFDTYWAATPEARKKVNEDFINIFKEQSITEALGKAIGIDNVNTPEAIIFGLPNAIYKTLVTGQWIGQFEIPYYGNQFLHAFGHEGWQTRSLTDAFDIGGGFTGKVLESLGLGNINIAIRPRFKFSNGDNGPSAEALEATFYLYNETIQSFAKNFNFLRNISAGPFWVQSGLLQRPSNLYNVVIPGRLNYYFCTLDLKIDYVGKTRRLGKFASDTLKSVTNKIPLSYHNSIASEKTLIPDGYKVTATFQSIVPNNYNSFAATATGRHITPSYSQPVTSKTEDFLESINKKINEAIAKAAPPAAPVRAAPTDNAPLLPGQLGSIGPT